MSVTEANQRRRGRRTLLSTGGVGLLGAGALIYQAAPGFWRQYQRERKRPIESSPLKPNPSAWPDTGLHAAWLGHSTVLLKIDGFTILTDPVFSQRAGVHLGFMTLGVKRLVEPALPIRGIPRPDLIVLSHAHMDHFDIPSLRKLEHPQTSVITASKTSDLLRVGQYRSVHELRWREQVNIGPLTAQGVEVNHWGSAAANGYLPRFQRLCLGSGKVPHFFAGDTADTHKLRDVAGGKPLDLTIMPIGAYNPWIRFHCTPEQAWRMHTEARGRLFLPVHHSTFQLSSEPVREPIERLYRAAAGSSNDIVLHRIGEEFHLA